MSKHKTEQQALDEHLQGNELFKDVASIVSAAIVCGYVVNYFI